MRCCLRTEVLELFAAAASTVAGPETDVGTDGRH